MGCGPAGLTLAAQIVGVSRHQDLHRRAEGGRMLRGQADGIACRTMEMFQAFGFSERVLKEAAGSTRRRSGSRITATREHRPQRLGPGRRRRVVGVPARGPESGARARFLSRRHAQIGLEARAVLCTARRCRSACSHRQRGTTGDRYSRAAR